MNTPTPDFVSKIACSSQTVSTIEEHNAASAAVSLGSAHGVLCPPAVHPATPGSTSTAGVDFYSHGADRSSTTDAPSGFPGGGAENASHGSLNELLPSRFEQDTKGLASALEASNFNEVSHGQRADPLEIAGIGRALAVAEELRHVEGLSNWMEDRLSSSVVSQWGIAPGSKRMANLWNELTSGECYLEDSRPPKRVLNVARVKIKNEKGEVLVEAYQEMSDGRRRERNRPLSEKIKQGEAAEEACLRGVLEELGAELGSRQRVMMDSESYTKEEEERDSISYPGLNTRFIIHSMEARIPQLPTGEFSTFEGESEDEIDGDGSALQRAVGVKRHFWKWVPESEVQ